MTLLPFLLALCAQTGQGPAGQSAPAPQPAPAKPKTILLAKPAPTPAPTPAPEMRTAAPGATPPPLKAPRISSEVRTENGRVTSNSTSIKLGKH